jgi:hypothetical protein
MIIMKIALTAIAVWALNFFKEPASDAGSKRARLVGMAAAIGLILFLWFLVPN